MLLGTKNALQDKNNGKLIRKEFKITEEFIEEKTCVKYLGIQIENQSKWKEHVASVSLKVSRAIKMTKYAKAPPHRNVKIAIVLEVVILRKLTRRLEVMNALNNNQNN